MSLFRRSPAVAYEGQGGRRQRRATVLDRDGDCWINNGYWTGPATFTEARRELARLVARTAELTSGDRLLDVGFGYAEQDLLWVREFDVAKIAGVDVSRLHVEIGQERVRRAGTSERIQLVQGSASKLDFEPGAFDKVIALESALHFNTRERFFSEAHRVLRPGGVLVTADMIPAPGQPPLTLSQRYRMRQHYIPLANMYDRNGYAQKLEAAGFEDVSVRSIANEVYDVAYRVIQSMQEHLESGTEFDADGASFEFTEQDRGKGIASWQERIGTGDYVIARATKPPL